jgi:hypothetical protein
MTITVHIGKMYMYNYPMYSSMRQTKYWEIVPVQFLREHLDILEKCTCTIILCIISGILNIGKIVRVQFSRDHLWILEKCTRTYPKYSIRLTTYWKIVRVHF